MFLSARSRMYDILDIDISYQFLKLMFLKELHGKRELMLFGINNSSSYMFHDSLRH